MLPLEHPALGLMDVYDTCAPKTRDDDQRARFADARDNVSQAADDYKVRAEDRRLWEIAPHNLVPPALSEPDLKLLYRSGMVRMNGPGRPSYDDIMIGTKTGLCPFCAQRTVSTLDHYLARFHFPAFSVLPINLVPACKDCNFNKLDQVYGDYVSSPIHPYFDNFEEHHWLKAEIHETSPASATFTVDGEAIANETIRLKVANHLETFKLCALYAVHSATEIRSVSGHLRILRDSGGAESVREHLQRQHASRSEWLRNSWQATLYDALSKSDWYCDVGFDAGF